MSNSAPTSDDMPISELTKNQLVKNKIDTNTNSPIDKLNPISIVPTAHQNNQSSFSESDLPPLSEYKDNELNEIEVTSVDKNKSGFNWEKIVIYLLVGILVFQIIYIILKFDSLADRLGWSTEKSDLTLSSPINTYNNSTTYDPLIVDALYKLESSTYRIVFMGSFTYPDSNVRIPSALFAENGLIPTLNIDSFIWSKGEVDQIEIGANRWIFRGEDDVFFINENFGNYIELKPNQIIWEELEKFADTLGGGIGTWRDNLPFNYLYNGLKNGELTISKTSEGNVFNGFYIVDFNEKQYTQPFSFEIDPESKLITRISLFNETLSEWETLEITYRQDPPIPEYDVFQDELNNIEDELINSIGTTT